MCERDVLIFVGLVVIVIVIYMTYNRSSENFVVHVPVYQEPEHMTVTSPLGEQRTVPQINPEVGSIVDGPGYETGLGSETGNVDGVDQSMLTKVPSDYYFLDDGSGGKYSITSNLFSKSCCSAQWPLPFAMKYDPYVCNNKSEYVGSNIMGNNTFEDAGCACLTKDQAKFLYNRGGNGREFF